MVSVCVCVRFFTFVFRHFLSTNKSRTLISYKTLVKHILFALFCSLQISTLNSFIAVIVVVIVFRMLCILLLFALHLCILRCVSPACPFLPLMIRSPCAPSPTARLNCIYIRAHSLVRARVCVCGVVEMSVVCVCVCERCAAWLIFCEKRW